MPIQKNDRILRMLRGHLGLTQNESLALNAIIETKGLPGEIATYSGIPRPKVYGALDSLIKQKLIIKRDDKYELNFSIIPTLKEDAEDLTKQYIEFIDKLYNQAIVPTTFISSLKQEIYLLLQRIEYNIERESNIEKHFGGRKGLQKFLTDFNKYDLIRYRHGISKFAAAIENSDLNRFVVMRERERYNDQLMALNKMMTELEIEVAHQKNNIKDTSDKYLKNDSLHKLQVLQQERAILLEKIESLQSKSQQYLNYRLPDFIAESPTSGIRIGILIFSSEEELFDNIFILSYILQLSRCNREVIITTFDLDPKESLKYFRGKVETKVITNATTESIKGLEGYFNNLDLRWINLKQKLTNLEEKRENIKAENRGFISRIENYSIEKDHYHSDYKEIFGNIIDRIKNDLETNDKFLSQMDELISDHFNMLERKLLFSIEDLSDIERKLEDIRHKLKEKEQELQHFEVEIYSIPPEDNPYNKYGYKLNPFSLWVALPKPDSIINQEYSKEIASEFITNATNGLDTNVMLITGEQGVGKSHFLNFFENQINNEIFGKSLAIKIHCTSNNDIVDLYPQITEGIKRILIYKKEEHLVNIISGTLNNFGTPRLVQDLMKLLKQIYLLLISGGYKCIFILIDEFENSLPPVHKHKSPEHERIDRYGGIPQSISQLASITRLPNIAFIITFRKEYWDLWNEELKERISKMENKYIINLESLSYEDSKKFLHYRLTMPEFKKQNKFLTEYIEHTKNKKNISEFSFDDRATRYIFEKGNGNPRKMLRLASTAFSNILRTGTMNRTISIDYVQ